MLFYLKMKKDFFILIIFINAFIVIKNETNYLKLLHCLRNSEKIQNTGNKIIKDIKTDLLSTLLSLYSDLKSTKTDFKKCQRKANDSFEFDAICVLKCLIKFQKNYDYSCLGSCYY